MIRFTVYGRPVPQGSKRHVGNGVMVESAKKLKPWRQEVTDTALVKFQRPYQGDGKHPVSLQVDFYFSRPTKPKNKQFPVVKPDIDKCLRAIMDALTGIAYRDDAQVAQVVAMKHYDAIERVEISVGLLEVLGV